MQFLCCTSTQTFNSLPMAFSGFRELSLALKLFFKGQESQWQVTEAQSQLD